MYCYLSRSATAATATTLDTATATAALDTVVNTKIYWFLKKMLQENPTERRYICA
jgi:hypothetical protein